MGVSRYEAHNGKKFRVALAGYHDGMFVKGLLLDLDGTLYVGGEAVPGAREAVARLKDAGLQLRYVTNTTRKPRREVAGRMRELGFEVGEPEIFTPARAAAALIEDRTYFPLVAEALLEDLGDGFTYARLDAAFGCLMDGADLIALQKNRYWMTETGLSLDAGPFVAALEYASGKSATVVGKPRPDFQQEGEA